MINILDLNLLARRLTFAGSKSIGRRGILRLLTMYQGTDESFRPPVVSQNTIQFSSGLRFSNDDCSVDAPLTKWRSDVEVRSLIRLTRYIDQYVLGESPSFSPLRTKFTDEFKFELELVKPLMDLTNAELKTMCLQLRSYATILYCLLRYFSELTGSEVQRLPSRFYTDDEVHEFFECLSDRYRA